MAKSACPEFSIRSVSSRSAGVRLLIKARITWRCVPMGSVRQTAGRTLVALRSSNGKGTRTTLPLIIERSPIGKCVDILFGIFQEIEGGVGGCCMEPFSLAYVRVFGQQDDYTNPGWSGDGQRFVQNEMVLGVDRSYCFNGLCCGLHFGFPRWHELMLNYICKGSVSLKSRSPRSSYTELMNRILSSNKLSQNFPISLSSGDNFSLNLY